MDDKMTILYVPKTKYPNKCDYCSKTIPAESECYWDKTNKKNYHSECYHKLNANPNTTSDTHTHYLRTPSQSPPSPKPNSASPESIVEQRLMQAKRIISKAFGMKESELSVENALVVEALRQLSSEEWLALERAKFRLNMR